MPRTLIPVRSASSSCVKPSRLRCPRIISPSTVASPRSLATLDPIFPSVGVDKCTGGSKRAGQLPARFLVARLGNYHTDATHSRMPASGTRPYLYGGFVVETDLYHVVVIDHCGVKMPDIQPMRPIRRRTRRVLPAAVGLLLLLAAGWNPVVAAGTAEAAPLIACTEAAASGSAAATMARRCERPVEDLSARSEWSRLFRNANGTASLEMSVDRSGYAAWTVVGWRRTPAW